MNYKDRKFELTDEQEAVVRLLVEGDSSTEAATALKVDPDIIREWRQKDIGFMAAYNDAISDQHRVVMRKLAEGRARAIERLINLIDHQDTSVALRAASILAKMEFPEPKGETDPIKLEDSMQLFGSIFG